MTDVPEVSALNAAMSDAPRRNYAAFRELREMVGISQTELAKMVDVDPRTVRRWESEGFTAPPDAWELLESSRAEQLKVCSFAVRKVLSIECERGGKPHEVTIPYHVGDGMERANERLVAHELERRGFNVRIVPQSDGTTAR